MNPKPLEAIQVVAQRDGAAIASVTLAPGDYLIGRDPACPIHVDSPEISRKHARLILANGQIEIEHAGGRYGTFINNQQIIGRQSLKPGQSLHVGRTQLQITALDAPSPNPPAPPPIPPPAAALTPSERYEVGELLAQGGMSQVAEARDRHLQRPVAIKVLTPEMACNPGLSRRFVQEALVLGRLGHPNIVPIHDLGIDPQGRNFYTMKYVRGITLRDVLDGLRKGRTLLVEQYPFTVLLNIFQKVCDAVGYAHSQRIIHRDLKPANIMLGDHGEVLVMDWGLAKILDEPETAPGEDTLPPKPKTPHDNENPGTRFGTVMGTPNYMAPEQADGRLDAIDTRTDIFALGAILYQILSLRPPVTGTTEEEVLNKIRRGDIPPPGQAHDKNEKTAPPLLVHCPDRRVPPALAAVAMQALSRKPSKRYQEVADLQKDIAAYQAGYATRAERAGTLRQLRLTIRRHGAAFTAGAVIILLVLGFGIHSFLKERQLSATLARLRGAAPVYYQSAQSLVDQGRFKEALERINLAVELQPNSTEYHRLKGNIHQSLLQFNAARNAYQQASGNPKADQSRQLNEHINAKITASPAATIPQLEALAKHMARQGRQAEARAMTQRVKRQKEAAWQRAQATLNQLQLANRLQRTPEGYLKINLSNTPTRELAPLANLPITSLNLWQTKVTQLRPLAGMPLNELYLAFTSVDDLSPLKGAPLQSLTVAYAPVANLAPLKGMPLVHLYLSKTKAANLAPLADLPLRSLHLDRTLVANLTPIKDMPLRHLRLDGCENLTDLSPLAHCKTLEVLTLPPRHGDISFLKKLPNLRRLSYHYDLDEKKIQTTAHFWATYKKPPVGP
ncbi:MAG: hypothetical protein CMO74_06050 [Verrucomicrobiales bacterium]|nr:hypothetical protein [Verrucomicrobiales bacterium]|tara:strand:- start:4407 stop:6944 length:2538 start_codon:yes stop_codon:yes gene_type:complete